MPLRQFNSRRPRRALRSACRTDQVSSAACSSGTATASTRPPASGRRWLGRSGAPEWFYNDALCERERVHEAGEQLSDTEVQRRVVTLAKQTPERAWLAEVASVVLVQACQDARRADRNWFDSRSGKRHGRRVGHPRFRTRHGRQSIRLTRNGFALHGTRL
jgi:putative transposase